VPGGPAIDGTAAGAMGVLRHVRRDLHLAALGYELSGVVAFVGSHRDPLLSRDLLEHEQRRIPFRRPVGLQQLGLGDQPVAVLNQQISAVAQFGFFAAAFAGQLGIRVGGGLVAVIGPFLAMEVYRRIAGIVRIVVLRGC
jgi:hypothetical protein